MIQEVEADLLIVESDFVTDPVYDLPLLAIGSCRGDPNNIDIAKATAKGIPVLRAPGRNADAVAEITVALLFATNRGVVPADEDVRAGEVYRDGTIPYQRYRAWQLAGRTAGLVGLGAVGRAVKWRLEGLGMKVIAYDPYADDATHSLDDLLAESDVVSLHAAVTPGDRAPDRCRPVRPDEGRRDLRELRAGAAPRHRRARRRAAVGQARRRRPRPLRRRAPRRPTTRSSA